MARDQLASCGGVLELTLAEEGRGLPEVVRRVQRAGLRLAGVASEELGGGVVKSTLHLRLATAARLKRAADDVQTLPYVTSLARRLFHD